MPKKTPLRMCLACREMKPKKELTRVVRSPEGVISIDLTGRKPGRGAYVCKSAECLTKAVRQKQLERTFSQKIDEELLAELIRQTEEA